MIQGHFNNQSQTQTMHRGGQHMGYAHRNQPMQNTGPQFQPTQMWGRPNQPWSSPQQGGQTPSMNNTGLQQLISLLMQLLTQIGGNPGNTGPGNTGPGNTGPGNTGPGNTGPGNTGPGNTGPGNTGPSGQTLIGGLANDTLIGTAGNDLLIDNSGNNIIDGGAGTDTLQLNDRASNYEIKRNMFIQGQGGLGQLIPDGYEITHKQTGSTNTVRNVENFQFSDQTFNTQGLDQYINQQSAVPGLTLSDAQKATIQQVLLQNYNINEPIRSVSDHDRSGTLSTGDSVYISDYAIILSDADIRAINQ